MITKVQQNEVALVSDDDEFFRVALSAILKKELGYQDVIEAGSFDEAVELLGENQEVSLALFDLAMPGMDSPANLKTVRTCFANTIVVVVSGSTRRKDVLLALEAGVHGYVPKALGVGELAQALRIVLGGQIYVPTSLSEVPAAEEPGPYGSATGPQKHDAEFLTPRQREVLRLLTEGKSNKEMARALKLGEGTVKVHLAALFRNLGVNNRASAAVAGSRLLSGGR